MKNTLTKFLPPRSLIAISLISLLIVITLPFGIVAANNHRLDSGAQEISTPTAVEAEPSAVSPDAESTPTPSEDENTTSTPESTEEPTEVPTVPPTETPESLVPTSEDPSSKEGTEPDPVDMNKVNWSLQFKIPDSEMATPLLASNAEDLVENDEVNVMVTQGPNRNYQLLLEGNDYLNEIRKIIFSDLRPELDILDGSIDFEIIGTVSNGQEVILQLESRPTTGFVWQITGFDSNVLTKISGPTFEHQGTGFGTPYHEFHTFIATADAETKIILQYRRPFEASVQGDRILQMDFDSLPETVLLTDPDPSSSAPLQLEGNEIILESSTTLLQSTGFPSSFDWRSRGAVPPIRNQGACGGCWSFATTSVMESALLIDNKIAADLSEQYLISCNFEGYGCNGGWFTHNYHKDKSGKSNNPPGAVLESSLPYSATNGSCTATYSHPYKLYDWKNVSVNSVASVNAIKAAIYNYGPVATAVCSIGFQNYSGGIYSNNNTSCNGGVDHAVVLVGWNDADQTWIMRNSWGSNWGENGYMRIRWGASNIGFWPSYVYTTKRIFNDVPAGHYAYPSINQLYANGITGGCGSDNYCPSSLVSRQEMAIFLMRGLNGKNYTPPSAKGIFSDVSNSFATNWIEALYNEGITGGCSTSPLRYCPSSYVTRGQMAIFLIKAKYGKTYTPPPAQGIFRDVPSSRFDAPWIEKLHNDGITAGCSTSTKSYCPDAGVTRADMAIFLSRAFNLK